MEKEQTVMTIRALLKKILEEHGNLPAYTILEDSGDQWPMKEREIRVQEEKETWCETLPKRLLITHWCVEGEDANA